MKYVIVLGDGMSGLPLQELGGAHHAGSGPYPGDG